MQMQLSNLGRSFRYPDLSPLMVILDLSANAMTTFLQIPPN
jgi:hypothetical protein